MISGEPDEYLARARYCRRRAKATDDPLAKGFLEVLAKQWREMAQQPDEPGEPAENTP
jgi:hypothetical protein